jgi:DNA polymerase I-like protein with 3'-5' exonuclease and polymerase domains
VNFVTLDFETYYAQDFSLSKITTEEYIRDRRFEVIGLGLKHGPNPTEWAQGEDQVRELIASVDWGSSAVLAHNMMFDGAILSWRYNAKPKFLLDTLCMARAAHGVEHSVSLKALTERYGLGAKGTEVLQAKGKRIDDFTPEEIKAYAGYCINDVELTYALFNKMSVGFPKKELALIDATLRMFTEPTLDLDMGLLEMHLEDVRDRKYKLMVDADVNDKKDLMSNHKFADVLMSFGVEPPEKTSPTTGKETFAFAKSDEGFKALQEHEDVRVQALVAARLGAKSTLEETRTQRFIDISKRGMLPVPVRYYAAHTGRWGGDDKINLQNLPSRGANGKKLKKSIVAPDGYTIIDADSSQIEARVLAWLAGQDDLTNAFAVGDDVYKHMASSIYGKPAEEVDSGERFVGKTTILGAGYGMGAVKFQLQLAGMGRDITLTEAKRIIKVYRDKNESITDLWSEAGMMLVNMHRDDTHYFGKVGVLDILAKENAIVLPSGLLMRYEDLQMETGEMGAEFSYRTRRGRTRIYGGKVVENVCQAIARCIIGEQLLQISKRYKVVLTVHDSLACCVLDEEVPEAQAYVEECMRWTPDWADGLPINCESGTGKSYGDCE